MKSKLLIGITISTLLLTMTVFNSCKKDDPDPCEGVTCLNGGTCVNGQCDCPEGYSGPDCGNQVTPSKIRITNIKLTKFPATDNGAGWDLTSGPDIYVTMEYSGSTIYDHPYFYQNADPSQDYDFQPNINLNMDNPTDNYVIRLYDFDDFDADDYMGGIQFVPYQDGNNFLNKILLNAGGDVAFELSVTYTW